jgi:hypothetical protein
MVDQGSDEVPVIAVRCDLVVPVEAVVTDGDSEAVRTPASDVCDGDVLVVV